MSKKQSLFLICKEQREKNELDYEYKLWPKQNR